MLNVWKVVFHSHVCGFQIEVAIKLKHLSSYCNTKYAEKVWAPKL